MDLNKTAKRAYLNALSRGKINEGGGHAESVSTLQEELDEFAKADEQSLGDHLPDVSEAVEELTDILIGTLTELYRRGIDVEQVVHSKIKYNETRIKKNK